VSIKYHNFHSHDGGSLLDGLCTAKEYIDHAIEIGLYGTGITNHGNCSTILEYYDYGNKLGYPTTLGEEFYIEESDIIFDSSDKKKTLNRYYHLIVIAMNKVGYENLMKLSSLAFDPARFYYRPRITFDDLIENKEGLICTSACIAGPITKNILSNSMDKAYSYAKKMKNVFGENWYLEIEAIDIRMQWSSKDKCFFDCGRNDQEIANKGVIQIANDLNIPVVIGLDSHMTKPELKKIQDVAIQTSISSKGWHFYDTYSMKTPEEVWDNCKKIHPYITRSMFEDMCKNTIDISDKCEVSLEFKPQLPNVENSNLTKLYDLLIKHNKVLWLDDRYIQRLKYEIDVIYRNKKINLLDYFFVLEDLLSWCRKNNVVVGPGRGSCCGSLLTYSIGISSIDPIKYGLLFERFLSLPRIKAGSIPDIDIDFSDPDKVKEYLRNRYGKDKVFSLGTVQQMKIKQAFTDVSRVVLGEEFDYFKIKQLSKGLPGTGPGANLELILEGSFEGLLSGEKKPSNERDDRIAKSVSNGVLSGTFDLEKNKSWVSWIKDHPKGKEIYEITKKILGLPRQFGTHACGLAISKEPMNKKIPTALNKGVPVTQFTASWCEYAGIVKFDILGLKTLKDFQGCIELIEERHKKKIDIHNIPINDKSVFRMFNKGETETVFQFNTSLQNHYLKKIKVASIEDLAVVTAIVRPGPLSANMVDEYIAGKKKLKEIVYEHPKMKEITEKHYGCLIFQEQIMSFFNKIGGLSLVESEEIRRAISKKKVDLLEKYKNRFLEYSMTKLDPVLTEKKAYSLWKKVNFYCSYSFNRSHAIAYSYIAYVCMWLKRYYLYEWWASVLKNSSEGDFKSFYRTSSINLELPEINKSKETFFLTDAGNESRIVIPFTKIKHIGDKAVEEIVKNQPYSSFFDFFNKVKKNKVKKDIMLALIFSNCFCLIDKRSRKELVEYFFELRKEDVPKEFLHLDKVRMLEYQGKFLEFKSIDYFKLFPFYFDARYQYFRDITKKSRGKNILTGGRIIEKKSLKTKNGSKYYRVGLYNNNESINLNFWNIDNDGGDSGLRDLCSRLKVGDVVRVIGDVNVYGDNVSINGKKIEILILTKEK